MNQLIIFIKNPIEGKVKTRLAATVGNKKALEIYLKLLDHTLSVANEVNAEIHLFFSDGIMSEFPFKNKYIQNGNDLGERMKNAFQKIFDLKKGKTIIIGTDCPGLNSYILEQAFLSLDKSDLVIGPAYDGGYYLLGMSVFQPQLFSNINWSTNEVLNQTKKLSSDNNLSFTELKFLSDIDTEEDLVSLPENF